MKMVTSEEGQGLKNGKKGSTPGSPQLLQPNGQGAESSEDEREGKYWSQVKPSFASSFPNYRVCPSIRFLDPPPPPLLSILYMTLFFCYLGLG